jgi:exopolysaccharide biosynthesis polyprenyl glycosylphosphotransferase
MALFAKRTFDVIGSGVLLVITSPLFVALAVAVKMTSRGPIFYKQERVGLNGKHFGMLKFRSMSVNADASLAELLASQGTNDKPLFKVRNDPRVTRAGRVLRKYSLDEFPQLINVFRGDMSLVGPRPQREGEVALYDDAARRRLLLKPGMSGLWQVSGRSSLPWEDAIRLDLYYVENWSLTGDLVILWRTIRAVLNPDGGAY